MIHVLRKFRYEFILLGIALAFVLISYIIGDSLGIFGDIEAFRLYIEGFGPLAPFVIILIIALETIVAPIPGGIPAVVAGLIFGIQKGILYTVVANILGASIAFFIARRWGRVIVVKLVNEEELKKFTNMVDKRQLLFWVLYFIPVFPMDILTFAIGLSRIPYKKFLVISSVGFVVSMGLYVLFGDYLARTFFI